MEGIRYVIIRYGTQYQLLMPYGEGRPFGRRREAGRSRGDCLQGQRSAEAGTLNEDTAACLVPCVRSDDHSEHTDQAQMGLHQSRLVSADHREDSTW
jgi:hypothetical protein